MFRKSLIGLAGVVLVASFAPVAMAQTRVDPPKNSYQPADDVKLRFSREYERQADIEGAQVMARAGYDPRDMANMFKTIEAQGGGAGMPEWLSDHPDPGNRYAYISQEAQALRVANPVRDTRGFEQAQSRLRQMSPAPTTAEASRNAENRPRGTSGTATGLGRVDAPSGPRGRRTRRFGRRSSPSAESPSMVSQTTRDPPR